MYSIYLLLSWQLSLDSCEFLLSKLIIAYSFISQAKSSRSASFLVNISSENRRKQCTFPHLHYNRTLNATPSLYTNNHQRLEQEHNTTARSMHYLHNAHCLYLSSYREVGQKQKQFYSSHFLEHNLLRQDRNEANSSY